MPKKNLEPQIFLRRPEVCARTGLKTSTLYEMMQGGTFPRPVRISKHLVVWPEAEIAAWQANRIAEKGLGVPSHFGHRDKCLYCERTLVGGGRGNYPKTFCSDKHRQDFDAACRAYAKEAFRTGRVSAETLRAALERHRAIRIGDMASCSAGG